MARAYHAPETLEYNPGIQTPEEERAYYDRFIAQMDIDIAKKNGTYGAT